MNYRNYYPTRRQPPDQPKAGPAAHTLKPGSPRIFPQVLPGEICQHLDHSSQDSLPVLEIPLPQEHSNDTNAQRNARQEGIFSKNVATIDETDMVVAVLDGVDVDSGTAWEIGYAYA